VPARGSAGVGRGSLAGERNPVQEHKNTVLGKEKKIRFTAGSLHSPGLCLQQIFAEVFEWVYAAAGSALPDPKHGRVGSLPCLSLLLCHIFCPESWLRGCAGLLEQSHGLLVLLSR